MAFTKGTLSLINQNIEGGTKWWMYTTADSLATVLGASYLTAAGDYRMQPGDIVWVFSGTLNTTGVTEGAAVFGAGVGVANTFTAQPQFMLCAVSTVTAGVGTLVEVSGGTTSASLEGFYGATPVAQPAGAAQAAITDASGGAAAATNGVLTLTGTYNSTILANAIATLAAQGNALRSALVTLGLIKGAA